MFALMVLNGDLTVHLKDDEEESMMKNSINPSDFIKKCVNDPWKELPGNKNKKSYKNLDDVVLKGCIMFIGLPWRFFLREQGLKK